MELYWKAHAKLYFIASLNHGKIKVQTEIKAWLIITKENTELSELVVKERTDKKQTGLREKAIPAVGKQINYCSLSGWWYCIKFL